MKKQILLSVLMAVTINFVFAQVVQRPVPPVRENGLIKTAPPPPAAPVTKATGNTNESAPVYSLAGVRVSIKTGADNKEFPSAVRVALTPRGTGNEYGYFAQENLKNEMKSNSTTEFGLEKKATNLKDITLDLLQRTGFKLSINYSANFQFDAWKIEGVTVTLEFRDQNGNLSAAAPSKTIDFTNATGFLNGYNGTRSMLCISDQYFNALSAYIE